MNLKNLVISIAVILLLFKPPVFATNLLLNSGFEENDDIGLHPPTSYGYWSGDAASVVGNSDGITPLEGDKMLKFIYANPEQPGGAVIDSDVWQIIDVSSYIDQIRAGNLTAVASANFNRVPGDAQTDTLFSLVVFAYQGSPSSLADQISNKTQLSRMIGDQITDGILETWEFVSTTMPIPSETDFLVVKIKPSENIYNDSSGTEFDGHYADAISLTVIPEPTTISLFSIGLMILIRKRW